MKILATVLFLFPISLSMAADDGQSRAEEIFNKHYRVDENGNFHLRLDIQGNDSAIEVFEGLELAAQVERHSSVTFKIVRTPENAIEIEYFEIIDQRSFGGQFIENSGAFNVTY